MKQVYHSNATTNISLREEINKSKQANNVLYQPKFVKLNIFTKTKKE